MARPDKTGDILRGAFRFFSQSLLVAVLWAVMSAFVVIYISDAICIDRRAAYVIQPEREWLIVVFSFISWLGELTRTLFPWPFVVLALALYFSQSPAGFLSLRRLLRLFKGVKTPYVEITLSEEARHELQDDAQAIFDALDRYRIRMNREIVRLSHIHDLPSKLERAFEDHIKPSLKRNAKAEPIPRKFRCTVHIPDLMFDRRLYQLLNYYPSGGGAGRDFSERYGIIGKVWRSTLAQVVGELLPGKSGPIVTENDIRRIALEWGLSMSEARKVAEKPSYACVTMQHDGARVGLFFMDSSESHAFSPTDGDQQIIEAINKAAKETGLAKSVYEIQKALEKISPRLLIGS
jgi:hypothetical protein